MLQVDDSMGLAPQRAMDCTGESGCLMKWVEADEDPWTGDDGNSCSPLPQLIQWTERWWWQVKSETSILNCVVVTPTDGIITSCVVCNPVSMNYISEQYNRYPLFLNCRLKHDIFSMNSHVNAFFGDRLHVKALEDESAKYLL